MELTSALKTTRRIREEIYPEALTVFAAGSIIRGEGTHTSDLDLVVVFKQVDSAYRESFTYPPWPVEAFVHDRETLEYFFRDVDRESGIPTLMTMVAEGIEVPTETKFGEDLKALANNVLEEGPPLWSKAEIDNSRYVLTNLTDDLRAPRSEEERCAILTDLYPALAIHYFRRRNLWAAKGKTIPRALMADDPVFARRLFDAFDSAFRTGDTTSVERVVDEVIYPDGGRLFEGYHRAAPPSWRRAQNKC